MSNTTRRRLTALTIVLAALALTTSAVAHDITDYPEAETQQIITEHYGTERAQYLEHGMLLAVACSIWWAGPEGSVRHVNEWVNPTRSVWKAGWNVEIWRPLVEEYFDPGDVGWALRVMGCESGGNPGAFNASSRATGLFQHLQRYWPSRSTQAGWGGHSPFEPEANVAVAAWLLGTGGKSHWVCR